MTTKAPVSALMPALNAEAFIAEAIESVHAQTLAVAELIVVDDGSTDRTAEIAEAMGARVIRQPNGGMAAARNRCVRESTQPWIAFIDSDDVWGPEKIEDQMRFALAHPEVALITCDYSVFDESGVLSSSTLAKYADSYGRQPKVPCDGGAIIEKLDASFTDVAFVLVPSFVIVRRNVLEEVGLFDETLFVAEDFDTYMRVLANHQFGVVESVLAKRREHTTNTSRSFTKASLSFLIVTNKVLDHPDLYPPATVNMCRQWLPANLRHAGARLVWDGEGKRGRDLLMQSARLELNWRTVLALGASLAPRSIGRELMRARYYVSNNLGF